MNPYMMPMDYTGYGPAQSGFFPTAAQSHQAEMQRFYSSRAAQAMQFQDPWIREFAAGAARAAGANPADPIAMRRQMYGTAAGQMALDAATAMRNTGFLGQGNPMAYSYHVNRGITSNGFGVNVLGTNGFSGPEQMVYGSGILSDRLAMTGQNALMQSLYGTGTADPSKLNGMNMESAGFAAAHVMRNRGPAMNAMTVIQNASMGERIASSIQFNSHDPTTQAVLSGLTGPQMEKMQALSDRGNAKDIAEFSKTFEDPKVQMELQQLMTAKDKSAGFVNSQWVKQTKDAVKEISNVVAGLRDVYEGMSDSQLIVQAESLTGVRVSSAATGRRQARMIDNLKSGALGAGVDANSYMGFMQGTYSGFGAQMGAMLGLGERASGTMQQFEAMAMNDAGGRAGAAVMLEKEMASKAGAMGVGGVYARDIGAITADIKDGNMRFAQVHEGITNLSGAKARLSGSQRDEADRILAKFSSTTDPTTRNALERQARDLLGQGLGGYSKYRATNFRERDMGRVSNDFEGAGAYVMDNTARLRLADLNIRSLKEDFGDDARAFVDAGGGALLTDMEFISRGDSKDKVNQMVQHMVRVGGMDEQKAKSVVGRLYDSSGKSRRSKRDMDALILKATDVNPDISSTGYGKNVKAKQDLLQMDQADNDFRSATKGDMSVKGIINAMASSQTGLLDSDQGKLALIHAMKGDNLKVMGKSGADLTDKVLTGLDVSKGFTADMVKQINAATGMDLAGAAGFKSTAELVAATGNDEGLARVISSLKANDRLSVTGGRSGLNILSKDAMDELDAAGHAARAKDYAMASKYVYGGKEADGLLDSFRAGGKLDIGLAADSAPDISSWYQWRGKNDAGYFKTRAQLANLGKFTAVSGRLSGLSDKELAAYMTTEGGRQTLEQFKGERASVAKLQEADRDKIDTVGEDGKTTSANTKQVLEGFDKLIERMEKMAVANTNPVVAEMTVLKMNQPAEVK